MPSPTLRVSLFLLTAFGLGTALASPLRIREASPQMLVPFSDRAPEDLVHGSPQKPPFLPLPPIPTVPLPPLPPPEQLLAREDDRLPRNPAMPAMEKLPRANPATENEASTSDPEVRVEEVPEEEESYESEPRERPSSGCHHGTKRDEELGGPGTATVEEVLFDEELISVPCCTHEHIDDTDRQTPPVHCTTTVVELEDELESELCDDGETIHILCSRLSDPTDL